ncbi:hypothetical protein TGME49_213310 [Toxoplasma gondii ME49]|uniref:Transmembrane protein n=1 Tax=Toxoplasma gondii (strain ATCC 50611 / Me49) TaxID=508771 RepID=S8F5U2_TOXGM|nr:hypothetical protein TGME49_213310 [Toxoplasma gondii ME49]EPT31216.1 hypothetical protein TGME49_213310 [Toxoplasma gondii ME49]|eukprot:XP_018637882.1 hypothetical protein TGME49_213310 [Toxoplasma gondii ME49]
MPLLSVSLLCVSLSACWLAGLVSPSVRMPRVSRRLVILLALAIYCMSRFVDLPSLFSLSLASTASFRRDTPPPLTFSPPTALASSLSSPHYSPLPSASLFSPSPCSPPACSPSPWSSSPPSSRAFACPRGSSLLGVEPSFVSPVDLERSEKISSSLSRTRPSQLSARPAQSPERSSRRDTMESLHKAPLSKVFTTAHARLSSGSRSSPLSRFASSSSSPQAICGILPCCRKSKSLRGAFFSSSSRRASPRLCRSALSGPSCESPVGSPTPSSILSRSAASRVLFSLSNVSLFSAFSTPLPPCSHARFPSAAAGTVSSCVLSFCVSRTPSGSRSSLPSCFSYVVHSVLSDAPSLSRQTRCLSFCSWTPPLSPLSSSFASPSPRFSASSPSGWLFSRSRTESTSAGPESPSQAELSRGTSGVSGPRSRAATLKTSERSGAWSSSWRTSANFAQVGLWRGSSYSPSSAASSPSSSSSSAASRNSVPRLEKPGREAGGEGLSRSQVGLVGSLSKWGGRRTAAAREETAVSSSRDRLEAGEETTEAPKARGERTRLSALRVRSGSTTEAEARPLRVRWASDKLHAKTGPRETSSSARLRKEPERQDAEAETGDTEPQVDRAQKTAPPPGYGRACVSWRRSTEGRDSSSRFSPLDGTAAREERRLGKSGTALRASTRAGEKATGNWGDRRETGENAAKGGKSGEVTSAWSSWKKASPGRRVAGETGTAQRLTSSSAVLSSSLRAQRNAGGEAAPQERRTKTPASLSSRFQSSSRFQPASSSHIQSPSSRSQSVSPSSPSSPSSRRPWVKWTPPAGEAAQSRRGVGSGEARAASMSSSPASLLFSLEKREEEESRMAALRAALSAEEVAALQKEVAEKVAALPAEFLQACRHDEKVQAFAQQPDENAAGRVEDRSPEKKQSETAAKKLTAASSSPLTFSPVQSWPCVVPANGSAVSTLLTLANYRLTDCERLRAMQPPASSFSSPFAFSSSHSASPSSVAFSPAPFPAVAPSLLLSPEGKTADALFHGHKQYARAAQILQEAPLAVRSLPEALVLFRLRGLAFKGAEKRVKMEPNSETGTPAPVFASSTLQAVAEALETGTCAEIRERKQQKRVEAIASLMQVDGVGRKTAEIVVDRCGILSPEELRLNLAVAIREEEAKARGGDGDGGDSSHGGKVAGKRGKRRKKAETEEREESAGDAGTASTLLSLFTTPQLRANVLHGAALTAPMHPSEFLVWQKKLVAAIGDSTFDCLTFSLTSTDSTASPFSPSALSPSSLSPSTSSLASSSGATSEETSHSLDAREGEREDELSTEGMVTPVVAVGGGLFSRSGSASGLRSATRAREIDVLLSMLPEPLPVPPASLLSRAGEGDGRRQRQASQQKTGQSGESEAVFAALDWTEARRKDLLNGVKQRKNELLTRFLDVLQRHNLVEHLLEEKLSHTAFPSARLIVRLPWNAVAKRQLRVRVVSPDLLPFASLESRCSATSFKEIQEHVRKHFDCQLTPERLIFSSSSQPNLRFSDVSLPDAGGCGSAEGGSGVKEHLEREGSGTQSEVRREKLKGLVEKWIFTEDQLIQALELPVPLSLGQRLVSLSFRGYISASGPQRQSASR